MSKVDEKLSVRWSKQQKDLKVYYPLGIQTHCDAAYIFSDVFNKQFQEEMINLGYEFWINQFDTICYKPKMI